MWQFFSQIWWFSYFFLTSDAFILILCSSNITFDSSFVTFGDSSICFSHLTVPFSHCVVLTSHLIVILLHLVVPLFVSQIWWFHYHIKQYQHRIWLYFCHIQNMWLLGLTSTWAHNLFVLWAFRFPTVGGPMLSRPKYPSISSRLSPFLAESLICSLWVFTLFS